MKKVFKMFFGFLGRFFPYPCIKAPTCLSLTSFMIISYIMVLIKGLVNFFLLALLFIALSLDPSTLSGED